MFMKLNYLFFIIQRASICSLLLMTFNSCKKESTLPDVPNEPKDTTLTIISISNHTVHYGDTLTIKGSNFSPSIPGNTVMINNQSAIVQSAISTEIKIIIPAVGATSGELKIKAGNQTASAGNITYVPDVFVAGSQNNNAAPLATYWKNGIPVTLSTEESALTSIFIHDNEIYAAGNERNNNLQLANYWKNGAKTTLGANASAANTIFVNGNDVYVGGWEILNGFDLPRYWKNGTATTISVIDPIISNIVTGNGSCDGIYVSANTVYAVGTYRNSQGRFSPWECMNGTVPASTVPNNDKHCFAHAVFVNGNDVYIVGSQNNETSGLAMATIWKNGAATNLTTGMNSVGVATSIFVAGSDVYVAGYEQENYSGGGQTFAKYWKNGAPVKLSNTTSSATGIAVFGNDVYVSGWENNGTFNIAKYWKNGVVINLGNALNASLGNGIAVR